uniref:Uncharacterized protein n=1 Tax=Sphaerodactylus townsendi TaxID=933632 RepID=A0ACB8FJB5_9SAUR
MKAGKKKIFPTTPLKGTASEHAAWCWVRTTAAAMEPKELVETVVALRKHQPNHTADATGSDVSGHLGTRAFLQMLLLAAPGRATGKGKQPHQAALQCWFTLTCSLQAPQYWVYPTSKEWWEQFILRVSDDEQWVANFRMSRAMFMCLTQILRLHLKRQDTNM